MGAGLSTDQTRLEMIELRKTRLLRDSPLSASFGDLRGSHGPVGSGAAIARDSAARA